MADYRYARVPDGGDVIRFQDGRLIVPGHPIIPYIEGDGTGEHLGWDAAADLVVKGLAGAIRNQTVTYDLERQMQGAILVSTSRFGEEIVRNMA